MLLRIPKKIEMILKKFGLWPSLGLKFKCKNKNALAVRLLSTGSYVLNKNNINFTSSLKSIITNVTSLIFVISVFATKNVISTYKKNFVFSTKNMQVKNFTKSVTKCYQNIFDQIKIFK